MKRVALKGAAATLIFYTLATGNALANFDQHDLEMLKTAKNVEIVSQKIAKAYFYKHMDIRREHADEDMKESLNQLKNDLVTLRNGTNGKEEKNVTTFLSYTGDELDNALAKPYSKETGALMIDFSESLLEGADFLSNKYGKGKSSEASMLAEVDHLLFLLERVNKYYIAHKAGFKDYNNVVQLTKAVDEFEKGLAKINSYAHYPIPVQDSVKKINKFWPIAKEFYLGVQQNALPVIVLASTDKLEQEVKTLAKFHHQEAERGQN